MNENGEINKSFKSFGDREAYNESRREYNKNYMKLFRESNRKNYNLYTCKGLKTLRHKEYKREVKTFFPKEELSNKLEEIVENNRFCIEMKILNLWVFNILNEKNKENCISKHKISVNPIWQKAIYEFMIERGYRKNGDQYVK